MIVSFSVQNFGSIRDKQTLSLEASKSNHLEDTYVVKQNGMRLLKLALVYGANASGKTTVLKALEFLKNLVLLPAGKKTEELEFFPFLFNQETPRQNSVISIDFIHKGIRYFYAVEFFRKAIVSEELYNYSPNKSNVYKRTTNLSNQYTEITFGSKIKKDKSFEKSLESNTLWNNTVLGGYLKTNIDLKELQEVIDWFKNYLKPPVYSRTELESFITSKIDEGEISRLDVIKILQKADFNISDILIQEKEEDVPDGFIEFLKFQVKEPGDEIRELVEKKKMNIRKLEFEHTVENRKYSLPFEQESQGTKRYYGLAGLLALLIKNQIIIPIDELEASLHPDIYLHFLISFLLNSEGSQLIAATHNREILDNKDIFRNDVIWFTNKNETCSTDLFSLADYGSSVVRNTTNILNAYKSGKLRGAPNLGDTFIDLNI